jgi:hypothetical protein
VQAGHNHPVSSIYHHQQTSELDANTDIFFNLIEPKYKVLIVSIGFVLGDGFRRSSSKFSCNSLEKCDYDLLDTFVLCFFLGFAVTYMKKAYSFGQIFQICWNGESNLPEKFSESKNLGTSSLKKLFRGYIFFIHLVQGKRKKW